MAKVANVVLLHGWGLNSAVWNDFVQHLRAARPDLTIQQLDLPGYGRNIEQSSTADLAELAEACIEMATSPAIWVGWSLGGLVAMQAALLDDSHRIQGLQLICSTPKFTWADDWPNGVDLTIFERFCDQLAGDYERALTMFLLLQAGSNAGSRALARRAHQAICTLPTPDSNTLYDGIRCLADSDLREHLSALSLPMQVLSGKRDRVISPDSSRLLAEMLDADLVELNCGHSPFMSYPAEVLEALLTLIDKTDGGHC